MRSKRNSSGSVYVNHRPGNSRAGYGIFLLIVTLILLGCSASRLLWPQTGQHLPVRHKLDSVPFYPQKAFQCGPSALAMALRWSGITADPNRLALEVFTPSRKGSFQSAIIGAARRHGRIAYTLSGPNALLKEVSAGHPVIVLQNLGLSWFPVWHYAVVVGYDLNQRIAILHSGVTPRKTISLKVFEKTWSRSDYWGLLVLPPTRLPATATEQAYVSAVLGLEKASQWQAAVKGYNTALGRWPDSFNALFGLGNSYYALGEKESAEAAFCEATLRSPNSGPAFNNLAQVLWEQGKQQDALKAARRAVKIGGPLLNVYRETLEEIQAGEP